MKSHLFAAGLLLLGAACHPLATGPHDVQVLVQSDGITFSRDSDQASAGVPFVVENRGSSTIYLARCGERIMVALDSWQGGQWVQNSGDACLTMEPMDPRPLAPGASVSSVRNVQEAGRYRLRPGIGLTSGESSHWLIASSNEFTVE